MDDLEIHALGLARDLPATAGAIERVAMETSPEAAAWAFTQIALRTKARSKFSRADLMLFEKEALEQATHEEVARYHASQFPADEPILDLTAGIGGDLLAFAERGPASGIEMNSERARYAEWNLMAYGLDGEVWEGSCFDYDWSDYRCFWADPARRQAGERISDPTQYLPDPQEIASRVTGCLRCGIKLSPMVPDRYLDSFGGAVEFISHAGECKEAVVWIGESVVAQTAAVRVESGDRITRSNRSLRRLDEPKIFLYDADPAAVRAHALHGFGMEQLGDSHGYLTSNDEVESPWLRRYRVVSTGPGDVRKTKAALRGLNAGSVILKQRGPRADLERLAKSFDLEGDHPYVLILWMSGRSVRHTIVQPEGT